MSGFLALALAALLALGDGQTAVLDAGGEGPSFHLVAVYDVVGYPYSESPVTMSELLAVIRNDHATPLSLLSGNDGSPACGSWVPSRAPRVWRRDGRPVMVIPRKRMVLQGGDSVYVALLLSPRDTLVTLQVFPDSTAYKNDTGWRGCPMRIADLPASRLVSVESALRAALAAVPGAEVVRPVPRMDLSSVHGKVWVVHTAESGLPRTVLVGALSGQVVEIREACELD